MEILRLQESLLKGNFLHCQPVENGPIIEASIDHPSENELPFVKIVIVCPARKASSKCALLSGKGGDSGYCHYYRGDSQGLYQIIGPGMDEKSEAGYVNNPV